MNKEKETFEDVKSKPLLKKFTEEELIQQKIKLREMELKIRGGKKQVKALEDDIAEEIPLVTAKLQLDQLKVQLKAVEFDKETLERMISESE